jgi:hypothetical protein
MKASRTLWRHATMEEVLHAAVSVGPHRACCYATVRQTHLSSSKSTRNNRGNGVLCGFASRLYNKDLTQLELELSLLLELAVAVEN